MNPALDPDTDPGVGPGARPEVRSEARHEARPGAPHGLGWLRQLAAATHQLADGTHQLVAGTRQLFEPLQCPGCLIRVDRPRLCDVCSAAIAVLPSPVRRTVDVRDGDPLVVTALLPYEPPWRNVILHFKEDPDRVVREVVQGVMGRVMREVDPMSGLLLAPIPAASVRLRERGFNPPEVLARWAAKSFGGEWRPRLLERHDYHGPLRGLGAGERQERLQGAMSPGPDIHHHRDASPAVILIDDVLTTGSTLAEAARALRGAGIRRISGLVLASAELGRNSD